MATSPLFSCASPPPPSHDSASEYEDSQEESVFFGQATERWAKAERRLLDKAGNRRDTIVPLKQGGTGKEILLNQIRNSLHAEYESTLDDVQDPDEITLDLSPSNHAQSPANKENITASPLRSIPRPSPFNSPIFSHSINKTPLLLSPLQSLSNAPSPLRFYAASSPLVQPSPRPILGHQSSSSVEEEISIDGSSFEEASTEAVLSDAPEKEIESEPELDSQQLDDQAPLSPVTPAPAQNDIIPLIELQGRVESGPTTDDDSQLESDSLPDSIDSLLVQIDSQDIAQDVLQDVEDSVDDSSAVLSVENDLELDPHETVEEEPLVIVEDLELVSNEPVVEAPVEELVESEQKKTDIVQHTLEAEEPIDTAVIEVSLIEELEEELSVAEVSVEESPSAEVSETELEEDDTESMIESADVSLVVLEQELDVEAELLVEVDIAVVEEEIELEVSDGDDSGEEFDEEESELEADGSMVVESGPELEEVRESSDALEPTRVESTVEVDAVVVECIELVVEVKMEVAIVEPVEEAAIANTIESIPAPAVLEQSIPHETSEDDLASSQQSTASLQSPSTPGPSHAPLPTNSASSTSTIVDKTPKASSSTPVATSLNLKKRQPPALAAPTARRQLSTLTSSRATTVSTLKRGEKRRSGLVANPDGGRSLDAKLVSKTKPATDDKVVAKISSTVIPTLAPNKPVSSSSITSNSAVVFEKSNVGFSSKLARPALAKFASTSRLPSSTSYKRPTAPSMSNPPPSKSSLASSQTSSSAFGASKPLLSRSMSATVSSAASAKSSMPPPRSRPLLSTSVSSSSSTSSIGGGKSTTRPNGFPAVRRFPAPGAPRQRVDSSSSNGSASSTSGTRTPGVHSATGSLMRPPSAASTTASTTARAAVPTGAVNRPLLSSSLSSSLASSLSSIVPPHPRARVPPPPLAHTFSAPALLMPVLVESVPLPSPLPIPTLARPQSQTFPSSTSSTSIVANAGPPALPSSYRPLAEIVNLARQNSDRSPEKRRALRTGQTPKDLEIAPPSTAQPKISENSAPSLLRPSISARSLSNQTSHSSAPPALARSVSTPSFHTAFSHPTSSTPSIPFLSSPQSNTILESQEEPEEKESILTSELLVDAEVAQEIFGSQGVPEVEGPVKLTKTRRTRAKTPVVVVEVEVKVEAVPLVSRPSRRTAATVAAASISNAASTRPRPSRRNVVDSTEPPLEAEVPIASGSEIRRPIFNPAPSLTQEELTHLTQRNTMKNKAHFNKLDVQTIHMDENRPPSPSTKVRKSLSSTPSGAIGKNGGRGERANKRRSALRSSIDGTGSSLLDLELAEESQTEILEHYRAPGDEEEFHSPVRPVTVLKSKGKKKSLSAATKLKIGVEGVVTVERKRVKWDRALVYEGPFESELAEGEEVVEISILKQIPLDSFGNSTATSTSYAKPASVCIKRILYKDDE